MRSASDWGFDFLCELAQPTPLVSATDLARDCGVGNISIKDETKRPLGSFKSLGGLQAAVKALARKAAGGDTTRLLRGDHDRLADLVCASAGNHALAVATAARLVDTKANVFVSTSVDPARLRRIAAMGAEIVRIDGTFDDAVLAAEAAARDSGSLLIADTSRESDDLVVRDVIAGYQRIGSEALEQTAGNPFSHVFVQAGVGGLAAGIAGAIAAQVTAAKWLVVIEPAGADCVGAALAAGRPTKVDGELVTDASMLACGEASKPALDIISRFDPTSLTVTDVQLHEAVSRLVQAVDIQTTPSGAAGLAGLLAAASDMPTRERLELGPKSHVLLIATEAVPEEVM